MVLIAHCSCGCGPSLSPPHPQHTHTLPLNLHFGSSPHMVRRRVKGGDKRKTMSRIEPHHTTTGPKTALVGVSCQIPHRGGFKDPLTSPGPWCPDHHAWARRQAASISAWFKEHFSFNKGKKEATEKKCPPITGGAASPDRSEAPNPITRDFRAQPCTGSCD